MKIYRIFLLRAGFSIFQWVFSLQVFNNIGQKCHICMMNIFHRTAFLAVAEENSQGRTIFFSFIEALYMDSYCDNSFYDEGIFPLYKWNKKS